MVHNQGPVVKKGRTKKTDPASVVEIDEKKTLTKTESENGHQIDDSLPSLEVDVEVEPTPKKREPTKKGTKQAKEDDEPKVVAKANSRRKKAAETPSVENGTEADTQAASTSKKSSKKRSSVEQEPKPTKAAEKASKRKKGEGEFSLVSFNLLSRAKELNSLNNLNFSCR